MSESYYVRIRGQVKGPVSVEQIQAQIRRKRFGRHHEVSLDGTNWQPAASVPALFDSPAEAPQPADELSAQDTTEQSNPVEGNEPQSEAAASETPASEEWHYSKAGNRLGPVSRSDIQTWLSTGRLAPQDLVWNQKMDNWMPVGDLPEFTVPTQVAVADSSSRRHAKPSFWEVFWGSSRAPRDPDGASYKFPNLCRYLSIAEVSVRIFFVVVLVLHLAGGLFYVGAQVNLEQWWQAVGGIVGMVAGIGVIWLFFLTLLASLEVVRVWIRIEHNTAVTAEIEV